MSSDEPMVPPDADGRSWFHVTYGANDPAVPPDGGSAAGQNGSVTVRTAVFGDDPGHAPFMQDRKLAGCQLRCDDQCLSQAVRDVFEWLSR